MGILMIEEKQFNALQKSLIYQKSFAQDAQQLYENSARMEESEYNRKLSALRSMSASKADIAAAATAMGFNPKGVTAKDKLIQFIEARRGSFEYPHQSGADGD